MASVQASVQGGEDMSPSQDLQQPQRPSLILALPDEILTNILGFASVGPNPSIFKRREEIIYLNGAIRHLVLTCRRFYRLATPFNYHTVRFDYPHSVVPSDRPVKALHRTLQENPTLGQHSHEFLFHLSDIGDYTADDFKYIREIALSLPNVRVLYIHGGFTHGVDGCLTWDIVRDCVRTMHSLRSVSLNREGFDGITVPRIMEVLQSPSLRSISISGVAKVSAGDSFWKSQSSGTSAITEIRLNDFLEAAEATSCLLNWPQGLTKLDFGSFYENNNYLDLPMLASMLQKHKNTLVELIVGELAWKGKGKIFDLSEFTALESLEISLWQLRTWGRGKRTLEFTAEDEILLAAPNLKSFRLDFTKFGLDPEAWSDLGEMEVNWLRSFAEAAVARKAPLREVSIRFSPEAYGITEEDGWPWDRMTALQDELQPKGIMVSYNEPPISREAWLSGEMWE